MTNRTKVAVSDNLLKELLFPGLDCSIEAVERISGDVTFTISGPDVPPDATYCAVEIEVETFASKKVRRLVKGAL